MRKIDVNLDMSLFDWFKPLEKLTGTVDKYVDQSTLDVDLANSIKAEIQKAEINIRAMAEQRYLAELQKDTIPWVDALHKMGRQILSLISLIVGAGVLIYIRSTGQEIDIETMLNVMSIGGPAAVYNYVKKTGQPTN